MCELIKQKWACGCEKPIFRNTICRHDSTVDARLCKLMKIESKEYNERCRTCKFKDTLRSWVGMKKRLRGAGEERAEGEAAA